jgi:hypothetical protein
VRYRRPLATMRIGRRRPDSEGQMPGKIFPEADNQKLRFLSIGSTTSCKVGSRQSRRPVSVRLRKKYKRCHGATEGAQDATNEINTFDLTPAEHTATEAERYPVRSPLSQRVARDGTAVEIESTTMAKAAGCLR